MIPCPFCNSKFMLPHMLVKHIKIKHNCFSRVFDCKYTGCSRSFQTVGSYVKHVVSKHNQTNFNTTSTSNPITVDTQSVKPMVDSSQAMSNTCNNDISNLSIATENLKQSSIQFISKLYSNYSLPRNIVQHLVCDITEMISKPLHDLEECVKKIFDEHSISNEYIFNMFSHLKDPFYNLNTEYLRFNFFKSQGYLIDIERIVIGERINDIRISNNITLDVVNCYAYYVPIAKTLKLFFELPGVYEKIISTYKTVSMTGQKIISSITQGSLWTSIKEKYLNKIVMPILVYFDDFEVSNPLGSHAGVYKIGAVYFSLACLPFEVASHLENIFLAQLHYTEDHKTFGNTSIFRKIVHDLKDLEVKGLSITVKEERVRVHFRVVLLLGDNLGLNKIMGYCESFRSNYFCRFCQCRRSAAETQMCENAELLRTKENYENDVLNNLHGVKEDSIWNSLPYFHVTTNISCDIMHDIFEGICRYDLGNILYNFIFQEKFFTLKCLNDRIRFFNFDPCNNKPPSISKSDLLRKRIIFSASEMRNFTKHLGLIIGDYVPLHNPIWEIYLKLQEIIDIVESRNILFEHCNLLEVLITEHNSLFLEHFGNLKPKYHLLLHYPRILKAVGPLRNISCFRYEGRHKQLKANANAVSSRRNIPYTLVLKNQLSFCHRILSKNGLANKYEIGPDDLNFSEKIAEYNCFLKTIDSNLRKNFSPVLWIVINGIKYSIDTLVVINFLNFMPAFGKINTILYHEDNVFFIVTKCTTLYFEKHVHAYEISEEDVMIGINYSHLSDIVCQKYHTISDGKKYVTYSL